MAGWAAGDPAPTAGRLATQALYGAGLGVVYGFGGNWLTANQKGSTPVDSEQDERSPT